MSLVNNKYVIFFKEADKSERVLHDQLSLNEALEIVKEFIDSDKNKWIHNEETREWKTNNKLIYIEEVNYEQAKNLILDILDIPLGHFSDIITLYKVLMDKDRCKKFVCTLNNKALW